MILRKLSRQVAGVVLGIALLPLVVGQSWSLLANEEPVRIDWNDQSLEGLIHTYAEKYGLKLEMGEVPPGKITHKDDRLVARAETLDLLRGFLLEKGFLLVERDKTLIVAELTKVQPDNAGLIRQVKFDELDKLGKNELIVVAFPPSLSASDEAVAAIQRNLSRYGKIMWQSIKGETLVRDRVENLRLIHEALTEIQAKTKSATVDSPTAGIESPKNNTGEPQEKEAVESEPASPARGLGASGFPGSPGGFGFAGGLPNRPRYTAGQSVAVTWSKSGDTVWGYSLLKGRWAKVNVTPPKKGIAPTVSASVIAVSTDDAIYAFGNQTARWEVLKSKGVPEVWPDRVVVEENGQYHIFSDATGRWASQSEAVEEKEIETEGADRMVQSDSKPGANGVAPKKPPLADQRMKDGKKKPISSPGQSTSGALGAAVGATGGGFGGGGFGGSAGGIGGSGGGSDRNSLTGRWTILPPSAIPSNFYVETQEAIVAWSAAKDTLWGYSDSLRKWNKLRIARPKGPLVPIVGFSVGAVPADDRLYAYSAKTGTWDELKTTIQPIIQAHRIVVEDKEKTYIFTAADGRWMSPNDSLEADTIDSTRDLRHRPADRLEGPFGGLDRLNAAPVSNSPGDAELLLQGFSAQGVVDDLRRAYDQTDREIRQAAAEYRKALERHAPDDAAIAELKSRIETLVEKAFTLRQQAQATEAEIHRHRLKQIDSRLAERERLKEKITQRRVQDLLNPALNWEAPAADAPSLR